MTDARTLRFSVDGGLDAAATARYTVTDGLGAQVDQRTIEDVLLVISELVTNAVRHAGAGAGESIDVAVTNLQAAPQMRDDDAPGGMGLVVVSGLCKDWGTEQDEGRKTVWAEYAGPAA
jgi:serine/threonine-protein kinase RsbW